jgi:hypothetical protein
MACFRLPRGLYLHINTMLRKFWWGSKEGERKPSWVSWKEMCKPKNMGGLGFRDIELFNLALLARQGWRLLQNPETLSVKILKARYYPSTDLLHAELGSAPSQVWRAIQYGLPVLKQGLIKRIGTGTDTDPVNDQWIQRDGMLHPVACLVLEPPSRVSDFIEATSATWKEGRMRQCFRPMDVKAILQIPLSYSVRTSGHGTTREKESSPSGPHIAC